MKKGEKARQWPIGYDRLVFDSLDSTLSQAAKMIPTLQGPAWILAQEQTAARGRRGRQWSTPRGNFAATLIMKRAEAPAVAALRSFVTSLALYQSLEKLTQQPGAFALKWPNDVLLHGGKVAGILLEGIGDHLAIGIGINLLHTPDPTQVEPGAVTPVSLRGALAINIAPEPFLDILACEYAVLEDQFRTHGFAPLRLAWLAHAARLGEVITARTMRDEITGVFEDVDNQGNLILSTPGGQAQISAADVFF